MSYPRAGVVSKCKSWCRSVNANEEILKIENEESADVADHRIIESVAGSVGGEGLTGVVGSVGSPESLPSDAANRLSVDRGGSLPVTTLRPWPVLPTLEIPTAPGSRRDWKNASWGERYRRDHFELLEIAGTLASELGYEGTQISDIVGAASVSKRTFYEHFDSKATCFVHLIRNSRWNIIGAMIAAAEAAARLGPHETFRRMLEVWRLKLATRPRLYAAMRNPRVEALWDEQWIGVDQIAEVFAVAAIRFGSTEAEVELARLSRYFTWGAFGMLSPIVMGEDVAEEDLSAIATTLCRGFGLVGSDVGSS